MDVRGQRLQRIFSAPHPGSLGSGRHGGKCHIHAAFVETLRYGAPSQPAARRVLDSASDLSFLPAELPPRVVAVWRMVRRSVFNRHRVAGPGLCSGREAAAAVVK